MICFAIKKGRSRLAYPKFSHTFSPTQHTAFIHM